MPYDTLASEESVTRTAAALKANGVAAFAVKTGAEALAKIKEIIPNGASVMNGASRTLEQIGFVEYLKSGRHSWNNLHEAILAEKDAAKQAALRKQAVLSDYYLGSVHALAETGEFIIASNSGSQLPHVAYTSSNIIFVASTKKIVPTLADAMERAEKYVLPLEDQRMKAAGYPGSAISKELIFRREPPMMRRKVVMILVEEDLGF